MQLFRAKSFGSQDEPRIAVRSGLSAEGAARRRRASRVVAVLANRRTKHGLLALALIIAFGVCVAGAQETTGTITGIVKDQSGGAIPGVSVTVRNVGTNATITVVSDETGTYTAPALPIGNYEVSAELEGFKKFVRSGLTLSVNDRIRVDLTLEPGQLAETVTVVAESPIIKTESSEVSTLINNAQVEQMPLNGRSVIQLVAMQPGVTSGMGSWVVPGLTGGTVAINVNGNRSSQNSWMIDGADNTDVGSNLGLINFVNVDAVAEVRILRSNYSAEFGRSGGGQINVVTKSGTNNFTGSGFYFARRDAWDAAPFFGTLDRDKNGKRDASPLTYDNYGYTVGGPILKDKLFFFWGQEWRSWERIFGSTGGVQATRTPTAKQRNGDFSEFSTTIIDPLTGQPFPGNVIPPDRIDTIAKQLLSIFPSPNADPNVLGGNRNFSAETTTSVDFREELARVDYRFSANHSLYGRFIHDTMPADQPFGEVFGSLQAAFPGIAALKSDQPGRGFVGAWNWVISTNMLNEAAYQYSRGAILSELSGTYQRTVSIPKVYSGSPGDNILPGISFSNDNYGGWNFFGPYDNTYGSHRIKDTLTWIKGDHSIRSGFLFSWEFKNENAAGGTNGSFTFPGRSTASYISTGDAFADFLLGRASTYTEANIDIASHLRFDMYEAFAQDDWKVKPNLTLNLGLRWSWIRQPTDVNDVLPNFDPDLFDPAKAYQVTSTSRVPGTGDPLNGIIVAGQNSPFGRRIVESPWANFGPRAGFAWDVTGNGRMAVRGGYGLYYDRTLVGIALQNAFLDPPFVQNAQVNSTLTSTPTFSNPTAGAARNNETLIPALTVMSTDFKIPKTHQWSLGMQRQIGTDFALDVAYVGSAGRDLLRAYDINQTPAGTPAANQFSARPYVGWGNITRRSTDAKSNYHSLQTSLSRRMKNGLQFAVNYTLSRVKTDSPSDRSDFVQDINNKEAEYALASFDRTHIFGASYIYEFPWFRDAANKLMYNLAGGWQISGFTRYESGVPLLVTTTVNTSNSYGNVSRRPDLVGDPEGPKTIAQWFNTAAFATPAPNTFGSAPRSVVRGPYRHVTDLGLFKNFIVTNKVRAQFRLEAFNVFNETNFTSIGTSFSTPSTFGRILGTSDPRLIQMGFKVTF